MKKRFKKIQKFVAVIATLAMATSMTTGMTSMATDITTEESLATLMDKLKDSSEDHPEDLSLDYNGDGVVNVADAVILEKQLVTSITSEEDTTEEIKEPVERTDYEHYALFRDPTSGRIFQFYKRYYVYEDTDFTKEYGQVKGSGVVGRPLEIELNGSEYILDVSDIEEVKTGTFTFKGEKYEYNVQSPAKYDFDVRQHLLNIIVHLEEVTPTDISKYDFDLSGNIDIRDVVYFNKVFWNVPWKWVTSYNGWNNGENELTQEEFWADFEKNQTESGVFEVEYFIY